MRYITVYWRKPSPHRYWDWQAYDESSYSGPGNLIGWGATEGEAIANLYWELSRTASVAFRAQSSPGAPQSISWAANGQPVILSPWRNWPPSGA